MNHRARHAGAWLVLLAALIGSGSPGCLALVDFKEKCDSFNSCEAGKRCDPDSKTCQPPIPCSSDAECGAYLCDTANQQCFFDCDVVQNDFSTNRNPHCAASASCSYENWCQ